MKSFMQMFFTSLILTLCAFAQESALSSLNKVSKLRFLDVQRKNRIIPTDKYEIYSYKTQSAKNRVVDFMYYKNLSFSKSPLLILVPAIGGLTPMEQYLAHVFAQSGYHVVITKLSLPIGKIEIGPKDLNNVLIEVNSDTRGVIDFVSKFQEVDTNRIYGVGTSLGGIRLAMMLAVEPKISAAVFIVAGADLPSIMTNSNQPSVKKYREYYMKEMSLKTGEEYKKLLDRLIRVDPKIVKNRYNPQNVLFFSSTTDKQVPAENQKLLWEILGKPQRYSIALPHIPAAGYFALVQTDRMLNFFESKK
jgi:dienelactone hydrolase